MEDVNESLDIDNMFNNVEEAFENMNLSRKMVMF